MSSYWTSFLSSIFPPRSEEEATRRENSRVDHLIAEKKLRIKHLKKKLKNRKKDKFMKRLESLPAKVKMVHINGLSKTSDQLVMNQVENIFNVDTFEDIVENTKEAHRNLKNLGCFNSVNIVVDTLPDSAQELYQVHITVKERSRVYGSLGLAATPDGGAGVARAGLANLWGRGGRLELGLEQGPGGLETAGLALLRPFHGLGRGSGAAAFLRLTQAHRHHLNSDLRRLGPGASLTLCPGPGLTLHSEAACSWLATSYRFSPLPRGPGLAKWDPAIETAGHMLRLGLKTMASYDTRDCSLVPLQGVYLKAEHCLSTGLLPFNFGHKLQLSSALHCPLPLLPKVSLHCRGLLCLLSGEVPAQELPLARTPNSPHPRPLADPASLILHCSLSSALPLLADNSVLGRALRLHAFLHSEAGAEGAGSLSWRRLGHTAGLGCVAKAWDLVRLELNYCLPLAGAGGRPGLRLSLGAELL